MRKLTLSAGFALILALLVTMSAFARVDTWMGEFTATDALTVTGLVQSVDPVGGTFTILAEDSTVYVVTPPEGFDLTLLVVGSTVEVSGDDDGAGNIAATGVAEVVLEGPSHDEILAEFHAAKEVCKAAWEDAHSAFHDAKDAVPDGEGRDEAIAALEAEKDAAEALKDDCISAAEDAKDAALGDDDDDGEDEDDDDDEDEDDDDEDDDDDDDEEDEDDEEEEEEDED